MKTRIVFYINILLLSHAAFLNAQSKNTEFGVGVLVGGSKLHGDIENTNMGLTGGLVLRYGPIPSFAFTATAIYGQMTTGFNAIKTDLLSASLLGTFFILPNNDFRPFVSLGLARFHYTTNRSPISAWKNAVQIGAGFELFTGKRWAINTMGNYNITRVDDLDAIDQGGADGFFHGLIGLVHYFKTGENAKNEKFTRTDVHQRLVTEGEKAASKNIQTIQKTPLDQFTNGIYFERGTATLSPKSRKQLHEIYRYLDTHPDEELELLGVSSENQSENELILGRANAVKTYLINLGIKHERIIINTN